MLHKFRLSRKKQTKSLNFIEISIAGNHQQASNLTGQHRQCVYIYIYAALLLNNSGSYVTSNAS